MPPTFPVQLSPSPELDASRRKLHRRLVVVPSRLLSTAIALRASEYVPGVHNAAANVALLHIVKGLDFACEELGVNVEEYPPNSADVSLGEGSVNTAFIGPAKFATGSIVGFSGSLSHLLLTTLELDGSSGSELMTLDYEKYIARFKSDKSLRDEWEHFFLRFAGLPVSKDLTEFPETESQRVISTQLTSAMEVFVLGRQYAIEISQHRPEALSGLIPRRGGRFFRELEADEFAWKLGRFLGERGFAGSVAAVSNTWMESGAASVAVIRAAEIIRRVHELLKCGRAADESTLIRPAHDDRLAELEKWWGFDGHPLRERFREQRRFCGLLFADIYNALKLRFAAAHNAGFRPRNDEIAQWSQYEMEPAARLAGLVDIIASDGAPVGRKLKLPPGGMPSIIEKLELSTKGDLATDVRQYLAQHQAKSIKELAQQLVVRRTGGSDPQLADAVAARLQESFAASGLNGFQELANYYCFRIEQVCKVLQVPLRDGVACGVVWSPARDTLQQGFFGTDASRIEISASTMMLCHYFSKLLAKAFSIKAQKHRLAVGIDADEVLARLRANKRLVKYAGQFLTSLATGEPRLMEPAARTAGASKAIYLRLLTGSELFVLAHEYAHHILNHGACDSVSVDGPVSEAMKEQELAADWMAATISGFFGAEDKNPLAHSGACGVLALSAADILRRAKCVLEFGEERVFVSSTHPPLVERLANLDSVRYHPRQRDALAKMRKNFQRIMEGVWPLLLPHLEQMHSRGIRPASPIPSDLQWLRA